MSGTRLETAIPVYEVFYAAWNSRTDYFQLLVSYPGFHAETQSVIRLVRARWQVAATLIYRVAVTVAASRRADCTSVFLAHI